MDFMKNKHTLLSRSILYIFLSLGSLFHILSHFSEYFNDPSFKDLLAAFVVVPLLLYAGISDLVNFYRNRKNDVLEE